MKRSVYKRRNLRMQVPMSPKSTNFVKWYAIEKNARHSRGKVASVANPSSTQWGSTKMDSGILIYATYAHGTETTSPFKTHHQTFTN